MGYMGLNLIYLKKWTCYMVLVGGFKHELYGPFHIRDVILTIDFYNICFKLVKTTNQLMLMIILPDGISSFMIWGDTNICFF